MLKTTFKKENSKRLIYHDYKNFNNEIFKMIFKMACRNPLKTMNHLFVTVLDRHAPRKFKILHGNQKPAVNKNLCKAITKL